MTENKKIAITGASSFTGLWLVRHFFEQGFDVHALFSKSDLGAYSGLTLKRVQMTDGFCTPHFGILAENGGMEAWILEYKPDFWIHHHHHMVEFRSPNYDVAEASKVGLSPLEGIVRALKDVGSKGIVLSGSFFEPGEGGTPADGSASTPYAKSKLEVWNSLRLHCEQVGLPLSKVVIPNPVGPLENEDRMTPTLIACAHAKKYFSIRARMALSDYLPVFELAKVYEDLVLELGRGKSRVARPSGKIMDVLTWAKLVNIELIVKRLNLAPVLLEDVTDHFVKPGAKLASYVNPTVEAVLVDWEYFWNAYFDFTC
jgi:nucleoside-diphosphate-sugar epimerase